MSGAYSGAGARSAASQVARDAASTWFYAAGAGLGHLTRALAVMHTLKLGPNLHLLSDSPHLLDARFQALLPHGLECHPLPPAHSSTPSLWRERLEAHLASHPPATLYVDCFPAGLLGELDEALLPTGSSCVLLARRLRWMRYRPLLPARGLCFTRVWQLEPLEQEMEAWLKLQRIPTAELVLEDPPLEAEGLRPLEAEGQRPLEAEGLRPLEPGQLRPWLVVHSGSDEELQALVDYARDLRTLEAHAGPLWLVCPQRPLWVQEGSSEEPRWIDALPAQALFYAAHRIVTGCGFNLMRQLAPFRQKHRFMPFERRFDDQHWRAARARS